MHTKDWIKEARRRCNPELFICRNKVQAKAIGVHPECLQVWDRAPNSHEPYFVLAIHTGGLPRDPSDIDIERLQAMSADRIHQGCKEHFTKILRHNEDRFERGEREYQERIGEWFGPGGEGYKRASYISGNRRVVAMNTPSLVLPRGRKVRVR